MVWGGEAAFPRTHPPKLSRGIVPTMAWAVGRGGGLGGVSPGAPVVRSVGGPWHLAVAKGGGGIAARRCRRPWAAPAQCAASQRSAQGAGGGVDGGVALCGDERASGGEGRCGGGGGEWGEARALEGGRAAVGGEKAGLRGAPQMPGPRARRLVMASCSDPPPPLFPPAQRTPSCHWRSGFSLPPSTPITIVPARPFFFAFIVTAVAPRQGQAMGGGGGEEVAIVARARNRLATPPGGPVNVTRTSHRKSGVNGLR